MQNTEYKMSLAGLSQRKESNIRRSERVSSSMNNFQPISESRRNTKITDSTTIPGKQLEAPSVQAAPLKTTNEKQNHHNYYDRSINKCER